MHDLRLRSRHWIINQKGDIIMGEGRKEILENIRKTGSINKTAVIMKMSYKGVWGKIKATERHLNMKLVNTDRRRGSYLTGEAEKLLQKYAILKQRCTEADDRIFEEIFLKEESSEQRYPMDEKKVEEELLKHTRNSKITCKQALMVAQKMGLPRGKVASILDRHNIKIMACQLGCF
jgi:molybdate transport system regulatory protein